MIYRAFSLERNNGSFNTGFKDSSGNEIFTGDFIQFKDTTLRCHVFFDHDLGAFFFNAHFGNVLQPFRLTRDIAKKCRIIGYCNQEVLS